MMHILPGQHPHTSPGATRPATTVARRPAQNRSPAGKRRVFEVLGNYDQAIGSGEADGHGGLAFELTVDLTKGGPFSKM